MNKSREFLLTILLVFFVTSLLVGCGVVEPVSHHTNNASGVVWTEINAPPGWEVCFAYFMEMDNGKFSDGYSGVVCK